MNLNNQQAEDRARLERANAQLRQDYRLQQEVPAHEVEGYRERLKHLADGCDSLREQLRQMKDERDRYRLEARPSQHVNQPVQKVLQVLDAVIQDVADHPEEEVRETTGMGWTVGTQTHSIPLDIARQTLSEIESPALSR